jgi:hypothetical protein
MANRHLVCHLLDLDLLEGNKLGGSGGKKQLTLGVVRLTLVGQALGERKELLRVDRLENFTAAAVTGIGIDFNGGLDIGDTSGDAAHSDQTTQMLAAHISNSEGLTGPIVTGAGGSKRLEVEGVSAGEFSGEQGGRVCGIHIGLLRHLHCLIALITLRHDDIQDIILESIEN